MNNFEIIDDLIDRKILIGKDSAEIKRVLGNPDFKSNDRYFWQYDAGTSTGFGFTDHMLIVKFRNNTAFSLEHKKNED